MKIISPKDLDTTLDNEIKADNRHIRKKVNTAVLAILQGVVRRRDAALIATTKKFDHVDITGRLEVKKNEIDKAYKSIPKDELALLELAARRIETFHKRQLQHSWQYKEKDGTILGQKVTPIEKVGIYVPGGKATYPSTVLMNAIPARVAGVKEIIMVTPPGKDGIVNNYVLAAAKIARVDKIFRVGGAQAIAALAYGTKTIPKVDKITGPGNVYVTAAKKMVYGVVDIDMLAGPSEILIINDGTGDAAWIAADLLAQAEHDEMARCILITTSKEMAEAVSKEVEKQIELLDRKLIARKSIDGYSVIIVAKDLNEAADESNKIAPEHLELFVEKPFDILKLIKNAGAVFMGRNTPVAVGDYLAGPNHTLPTGGTARFSSPLGVEDFIKRTSVISFSKKGINALGPSIARFAEIEGLEGHGRSVKARIEKSDVD
ncbi:MAG: histidinol dehydrogenase [Deltaproteobacteria bacterium]|nr:histidinol dehydrogenase [Deltaproteobacteria bacterium]